MSHDDTDRAETLTDPATPDARPSASPVLEPHPVRIVPLAFGIAFAAVATVGLTGASSGDAVGWLWVIALVVFGLVGVVAGVSRRS